MSSWTCENAQTKKRKWWVHLESQILSWTYTITHTTWTWRVYFAISSGDYIEIANFFGTPGENLEIAKLWIPLFCKPITSSYKIKFKAVALDNTFPMLYCINFKFYVLIKIHLTFVFWILIIMNQSYLVCFIFQDLPKV